jgi:hypothetical protein
VKQARKTFEEVVNEVSNSNRVAIISKARIANQLAKGSYGRSRKNAYAVKVRCLKALTKKFREEVELRNDLATPGMLLVTISKDRFGLHAPKFLFGEIVTTLSRSNACQNPTGW